MLVGGLGPPIHPLKSHTANMLYYTAKSTNNSLLYRLLSGFSEITKTNQLIGELTVHVMDCNGLLKTKMSGYASRKRMALTYTTRMTALVGNARMQVTIMPRRNTDNPSARQLRTTQSTAPEYR